MKLQTWIVWIVTGLMAALLVLSAIPDVLQVEGAVSVFRHLGYPPYLLLFLGTAKLLASRLDRPDLRRTKEWAFAGLTFDVTGALYSTVGQDSPRAWMPALIALMFVGARMSRTVSERPLSALPNWRQP